MSTKYTKEILEEAVKHSESFAGVVRHLGLKQAGGTQSHIIRKVKLFGIDTSHFTGQAHGKGKRAINAKTSDEILVKLGPESLRPKRSQLLRAMLEKNIEYVCSCGLEPKWNGKPLTLEIDHIDGDWLNNEISNLRFLCPNCHSQEPTNKSWKNSKPA